MLNAQVDIIYKMLTVVPGAAFFCKAYNVLIIRYLIEALERKRKFTKKRKTVVWKCFKICEKGIKKLSKRWDNHLLSQYSVTNILCLESELMEKAGLDRHLSWHSTSCQ